MSKKWIKISTYVILPLVIIGGFLYWATWTGSTDDIERVANQFKVPSSWKLIRSEVVPPKTDCIGMTCPRLSRTWETPHNLTNSEVAKLITNSKWATIKVDQDCIKHASDEFGAPTCSYNGVVEKYTIRVSSSDLDSISRKPSISLFMQMDN